MPEKRSQRGDHMWSGEKMSPNCLFFIACKNEGGGKEVTDRRPFSEGQKYTLKF